jgi:hypothetical protein
MADKKPTAKDVALLRERPDLAAKFDEVYGAGTAARILSIQPPQAAAATPAATEGSYIGAATRGLTPVMVGAGLGAPLGPVGMLAGSLALPAADALTALTNVALAGAEKMTSRQMPRVTPPSQGIQNLLTQLGVPQAQTTGQKLVESGVGALGGTAATLPGLARMAQTAVTPTGRAIAEQLAARPGAQLAVAAPAGAAGRAAAEAAQGAGPLGQTAASMLASTVVGGAGMAQPRGATAPGVAPSVAAPGGRAQQRAADIAKKARELGFVGETALTPAQAGTGKIAQLFEATASTLPMSAGQFQKRYGAQADFAEDIIRRIADQFGGMPTAPDAAFSSGAGAVKAAARRNVDTIGSQIRQVASQSDIDLNQVPNFRESIEKARKLLESLPPVMRKDPLFEKFEQFYFGTPNADLKKMVDSALEQVGIGPTNPNYRAMAAKFRKELIDSGEPEFEFLGLQQKGSLSGSDYLDQRILFGDLAFANKGSKIGEAFRALRDALDNARDETFKQAGLENQVTKLKELRGSYGAAKDLNKKIESASDKTAINYVTNNQDGFADKVIPLLKPDEKQSLSQAILADIQQSSLFPTGEIDITKFGRNVIKDVKASPTTLPKILGQEAATTLTDLAQVAQSALKAKVPTSGTAERTGMMGLLTSTPAKVGAAMAGGTAITGEPILGTTLALATPALATRAYLSPAAQNLYRNIADPLINYAASPVDAMLRYAASPAGLLMSQDEEPYRIDLRGMAQ